MIDNSHLEIRRIENLHLDVSDRYLISHTGFMCTAHKDKTFKLTTCLVQFIFREL